MLCLFDEDTASCQSDDLCFVYGPDEGNETDHIKVHFSSSQMTMLDHMKFLHTQGFTRAVICQEQRLSDSIVQVVYHNNVSQLDCQEKEKGSPTPWPARQPQQLAIESIDLSKLPTEKPNQLLGTGLDPKTLSDFFASTRDMLCTHTDHLPLLDVSRAAISQCVEMSDFDRYLIFTDGTSQGWARRHNPLQLEESGHGDAWAFLVLGEKYIGHDARALTFLGWTSQKVVYGEQESHHLGTNRIGAECAEKKALTWAALWRLAQNNTIPTTFCVDSLSTAFQADGSFGASDPNPCLPFSEALFKHWRRYCLVAFCNCIMFAVTKEMLTMRPLTSWPRRRQNTDIT